MTAAITIAPERADTREVGELLAERDAYFDRLYANEDRTGRPANVTRENVDFFAVRVAAELAGCGAIIWRDGYGELKRFYVRDRFRGHGLGRHLLETVELHARSRGCQVLRLETGTLQPEAIALYRSSGFRDTACFGEYTEHYLSIFLEKTLD
jgi:putative acetyltransferase